MLRQRDGQTDKWTNRQMDKQINGQTDKWTNRQMDRPTNEWIDRWEWAQPGFRDYLQHNTKIIIFKSSYKIQPTHHHQQKQNKIVELHFLLGRGDFYSVF